MTPSPQQTAEQQQENPQVTCFECGEPIIVFGGRMFYTCEHQGALPVATPHGVQMLTGVVDGL